LTIQPTPGKEIFVTELNVLWGDMDAYNHVNNVAYFRYLEETRVRWMMRHHFMDEGVAIRPVLVKSGVTFLKSALYPASRCGTRFATRIIRTSVTRKATQNWCG
jgi:acyl-CoA thioester hydrolase